MEGLNSWLDSTEAASTAKELADFDKSARKLLSEDRSLAQKYDKKWIGVYHESVVASANELDELIQALGDAGVPAANTVVRYIEREERTLIL